MEPITHVGLDVHARSIVAAVAAAGRERAKAVERSASDRESVRKLVGRLKGRYGRLRFVQEAGPCGAMVHRWLTALGEESVVAAPSRLMRAPGERVKTDKRDACKLAEEDRAGRIREVWIGDEAHEAMRDLVRGRDAAVRAARRARQQASGFLLRQGRHWGRRGWTQRHRAWVAGQRFEQAAHTYLLGEMIEEVGWAEARIARLTQEIMARVPGWALAPVVAALMALRGIGHINATVIAAELGDLRRFPTAPALMSFVGMTPSEHSSGERRRRGGITLTGNARARAALVEAAWTYRYPARTGPALAARLEGLPTELRALSWKAQQRLCRKFRRLLQRKPAKVAVVAVARELLGFIWAIGQCVPPRPGAVA
ncbi:MAG: IS110 family transposase [Gemmatimonadales bacterium]